jgi:hypothetical protein
MFHLFYDTPKGKIIQLSSTLLSKKLSALFLKTKQKTQRSKLTPRIKESGKETLKLR